MPSDPRLIAAKHVRRGDRLMVELHGRERWFDVLRAEVDGEVVRVSLDGLGRRLYEPRALVWIRRPEEG